MSLYLIPVDIGFSHEGSIYSPHQLEIIYGIKNFVAENASTARKMLKKCNYPTRLEDVFILELNEHNRFMPDTIDEVRELFSKNVDVGLMSEAGMPCVADPGSEVVRLAHKQNKKVVPLHGPSSIMMALVASGLNGQNFTFHGYLPAKTQERQSELRNLRNQIKKDGYTHILMDAPYRSNQILADMLTFFDSNFDICVAAEIGTENEYILTQKVEQWKKRLPDLHKKRCIFCVKN